MCALLHNYTDEWRGRSARHATIGIAMGAPGRAVITDYSRYISRRLTSASSRDPLLSRPEGFSVG